MGVVYKAQHLRLSRLVALKMILVGDHAGPQERVRFLAEAKAVAALQHPQIVSLLDFGEHQGRRSSPRSSSPAPALPTA